MVWNVSRTCRTLVARWRRGSVSHSTVIAPNKASAATTCRKIESWYTDMVNLLILNGPPAEMGSDPVR